MIETEHTLHLTINGEPRELAAPLSVAGLLSLLDVDRRKAGVERNLEIVPYSQHDRVMLESGDRIEIVAFVGGG